MKKIIIHWTAGGSKPNSIDLQHYHFIVDQTGIINNGIYKPEDNENCFDGKYAQHTGGGNTGAIGISMCGMMDYSSGGSTPYPLTKIQFENTCKKVAELCKKYGILITPTNILTHYEFGQAHPKSTSYGKIDIIYLPPYPTVKKDEVGDFIRSKVQWYYGKLSR